MSTGREAQFDSPEGRRVGFVYGAMRRRTPELRRAEECYIGRSRHYRAWVRLTHDGRRSPSWPECYRCGEIMTAEEIREYESLKASVVTV